MDQTEKTAGAIAPDSQYELEVYRVLKPYVAQCLTLNHDLNNQLAGIIGNAEIILQEPDGLSEEQLECLNQIVTCAQRINQRVHTLSVDKIALGEKIDLKKAIATFKAATTPSD